MLALFGNHQRQEPDAEASCGEFDDEINLAAPSDEGRFEAVARRQASRIIRFSANPVSNKMKGKLRSAGISSERRRDNETNTQRFASDLCHWKPSDTGTNSI